MVVVHPLCFLSEFIIYVDSPITFKIIYMGTRIGFLVFRPFPCLYFSEDEIIHLEVCRFERTDSMALSCELHF